MPVTENVVLGQEPGSAVWLDFDAAKDRIAELGEIYGLPVKPDAYVAELGVGVGDGSVPTAEVASNLSRKPQSLSPARDGLIKKGLVYSGERGTIAFTVPHFGEYLRKHG